MDGKITLYNSDGSRIGETYARRARQLVGKQRAEWVDGSRAAIRFMPDEDGIVCDDTDDINDSAFGGAPDGDCGPEGTGPGLLYAIAKQRIHERNMFIAHSAGLIPGYLFILAVSEKLIVYYSRVAYSCFFYGAWSALFAVHLFVFARNRYRDMRSADRLGHKARGVEREVEKLKRMGYTG